jgi:hypothetical protein
MKSWKDISLFLFQRIDRINEDGDLDELDKVLYCTCELFGLTDYQLGEMPKKDAAKLIKKATVVLASKPEGKVRNRIGPYSMNYDPADMTLGQFVELRHFLQEPIHMGHFALASIASPAGQPYQSDGHPLRADYFLRQPVVDLMASLNFFINRFKEFIKSYTALFGLDEELYADGQEVQQFNRRFGWIYSATTVADHERITLDQAYGLPIRQAFNDLIYLKELGKYEAQERKRIMDIVKLK